MEATEPGSFRALRPIAVHAQPDAASPIVASVGKDTRLPRAPRVKGKGCGGRFLHLAEGWYACMTNLRPDSRPPEGTEQPTLGANALTPGTYGFIRTGGTKLYWTIEEALADRNGKPIRESDTVRWAGKRNAGGKAFWRTTRGWLIHGDRVARFWPSTFQGVDLIASGRTLPLVFAAGVRRRQIGEKLPPIPVHRLPGGPSPDAVPRYSAWPTDQAQRVGDARWYRMPGKGWVSSELVRVARLTDPPDGLHPAERWIDVDLDEQTLVAYRGRTPVYATMIAAGVWKYPTPVGTFRIQRKVAEADMRSEATADEQYAVDHVPWTMYFKGGYALHGAYWHDGFGHARSHGCVNLAPKDARVIYHFVRPGLPPGFANLTATEKLPGTVVRIRGRKQAPPATP
jgi:hypothetical protein